MSRFIVLEGTDGSGKATQTSLLCARLDALSLPYRRLAFPRYEEPSSMLLRMYLRGDFGPSPDDVNPYAASVFFSVDRYASFKCDWQAAYEAGEIIVADRYTTSNAIHQASKLDGDARDSYLDWLFDFEYRLMGLPAPDRVVFLDMPAESSFDLIRARQGETGDIHEKDHAYLARCRENALDVCARYGWSRVSCVRDGMLRTPEDIASSVWAEVKEVLGIE